MSLPEESSYILVVDDDLFALKLVSQILKPKGILIRMATAAADAQKIIEASGTEVIQAVLTDYRMPGMSGLELVKWIHQKDPTLGVVMLTAEGDKKLVTESLRYGVSDFLDKPIDALILTRALDHAIEQTKVRRSLQRAKSSVDEVSHFHQSILGLNRLREMPGVKLFYHSLEEAGGDMISLIPLDLGKWALLGADVSGHDLKAAFLSAYFQGVSHAMLKNRHSISEVLTFINHFIAEEWNVTKGESEFPIQASLAVAAVTYDAINGRIGGISMGFPLPLLLTDSRGVELLGEDGPPLGWSDLADFEIVVRQGVTDGWIFLWSDGLNDFALRLKINAMTLAYRLLTSSGKEIDLAEKMPDDLFVLGYQLKSKAIEPTLLYFERVKGDQISQIDELQASWERNLRFLFPRIDLENMTMLLLLLREVFLNALEHGAQKMPNKLASLCWFWDALNSVLSIRVDDPGEGHSIDLHGTPEQVAEQSGSTIKGLYLIKTLSKTLRAERSGATLHLEYSLKIQRA